MSVLSFPSAARRADLPQVRGIFASAILSAASTFAREWRTWKASRSLEALSDEMLHDIGISRGEVESAARHGRPFRP